VARDDDIAAIVELGRRTRRSPPRGLWIAAALVGVVCATGFAIVLLADPEPTHPMPAACVEPGGRAPGARVVARSLSGLLTGLVLGLAAGIVIGVAIGRQRSHSSRSSP
jgi:ABC-type nitrate/sulfonate/bicarbonate transport system permease component